MKLTDPDDDEVAERRRVVNYAKRHALEPVGKRIGKVPYGGPGLELLPREGPASPCAESAAEGGRGPGSCPRATGAPASDGDRAQRRRESAGDAICAAPQVALLLQGLAADTVRRRYGVRTARSVYFPRAGGVDVGVDGFAYTVTARQEFPESTEPERAGCLVAELAHGLTSRPSRGRERK